MAASEQTPRGAHLVGSVPLGDAEEVFRSAVGILGRRLRRVPDGETGERSNWIVWQLPLMAATEALETVPPEPGSYRAMPALRLRAGATGEDVAFGELGYAAAARASYAVFQRLRSDGVIPEGMRFQVSLPTPLAPVGAFVLPDSQAAVEGPYTRRLLAEVEEICASIPARDLAIQWDVAVEMAIWEGVFPTFLSDPQPEILRRLVNLGNRIPEDIELGYHLCYGDLGHRHFSEPSDTANLVTVANGTAAGVRRSIQFLHMPVPRSRTDAGYFEPLRGLERRPETELYLGLVHYTDGVDGTRRRIRAAQVFVGPFGVATECGLGRRPPETIPELLRIHAEVAEPFPR